MGLAAVRGIGEDAAAAIVAAREEGPFRDLRDAARRIRVRPKGPGGGVGLRAGAGAQRRPVGGARHGGGARSLGVTRREGLWASGALALEGPDTLPGVAVGVEAPTLPGRLLQFSKMFWYSVLFTPSRNKPSEKFTI